MKLAKECFGDVVPLWRHGLQLLGRFLEGYVDNLIAMQRRHAAEAALVHEVGGLEPVASGEHAVAGRRRAAPLHVAEHRHAGLEAGPFLDLPSERIAYAAEADVPKGVLTGLLRDRAAFP